jgi:hypothetical protein
MPSVCETHYDEQACRDLVHRQYEKAIRAKFGPYVYLSFDLLYQWTDIYCDTPRLRAVTGQIPCASFYYTEFLVELQPDRIYDIGCGMNFFKDILPNVIGIDDHGNPDLFDHFDKDFVSGHENAFGAVMSVDALHFISLEDFGERVMDFFRIVTPGGRGYLAMNAARMWSQTPHAKLAEIFGSVDLDIGLVARYIDAELDRLPIQFLVRENIIEQRFDECIDGNIRLILQK